MIHYFNEDIIYNLKHKRVVSSWIKQIVESKGFSLGDINVIFTSDAYLLEMNNKYLGHNYYTDIITFDYCDDKIVSGDLFISIDCVKSNSEHYGQTFDNELHRVIIHGVLHLIGFDDHNDDNIKQMRNAEDEALVLYYSLLTSAK